jgi:hypothetical protein
VQQEHKSRDWELLRIFVFLAILTVGLVTALRWVVMTPGGTPALVKPAITEGSDRAPAEN